MTTDVDAEHQDLDSETIAVSGLFYFFSAAADVAMAAADSAEMTVVSGLSYCSSSAEAAVIATMAADVTNAAKLNIVEKRSLTESDSVGGFFMHKLFLNLI